MAEGLAAVLVAPDLRGGDDEETGFDRSRAQKHVPVRAAGRHGERGGNGDHVRVSFGDAREQQRETQVVADGEAELTDRRAVDQRHALARRVDGEFAPALAGRQVDVEQVDLVVAGADLAFASMTKPRLATLPFSTRTASEPMSSQMRLRLAASRQAASTRSSSSLRRFFAARALSRSSSPDISGVNSISAPPDAASSIASTSARAFASGSMPVLDWKSAIFVMRRSAHRARRLRSSATRSSQPPTCRSPMKICGTVERPWARSIMICLSAPPKSIATSS